MKVIRINESKFNRLLEEKDELPFQTFYEEVLKFIKDLLNKPIEAKPSETLMSYGLTNGKLRKKLCDYGVINKKEDIREPYDESDGKQKSRYYVSYSVPRKDFKDKLRELHKSLSSINEGINENKTLHFFKKGDILYPMGNTKEVIGKDKVSYDAFDFGLSQNLVKKGYKIAISGDI